MFSSKRSRVVAAGIAAVVIAGGSYGIVDATSSSATTASSSSGSTTSSGGHGFAGSSGTGGFAGGSGAAGSGSNARSGPAAGGSVGTAGSGTSSGFTLTTSTGQKVTIKEASSTTYEQGTSPASISAVTSGASVLVLGTTDSSTITASQVIVDPPSSSASSPGGQTIGYSKGTQGSTEKVGTIPSDYSQGSGTLASGTTADKATEAALAVYPGGTIDRVVELSNGDYEVHNIGVNWPHHIFVNADFQVIGADD
jgi:membrane-bound inhibitor of C-type lysozyme